MGWVGLVWSFQSKWHGGGATSINLLNFLKHFATKSLQPFPSFFIYTCTFYIHFRQRFETTSSSLHQYQRWRRIDVHAVVTAWFIRVGSELQQSEISDFTRTDGRNKNLKDGRSWCWCWDGDVVFFVGNVFFGKKHVMLGWKKTCQLGCSQRSRSIPRCFLQKRSSHIIAFFSW